MPTVFTEVANDDIIEPEHINQFIDPINALENGAALLSGRTGGQTLQGGTTSGENLTLQSTAHATKGKIRLGGSTVFELDESSGMLGLGIAPNSLSRFYGSWSPAATDQLYRPFNFQFLPTFTTGSAITNSLLTMRVSTNLGGSDAIAAATGINSNFNIATSGVTSLATSNLAQLISASGAGTITSGRVYSSSVTLSGAGNITTCDAYLAASPTQTSTGVIVTNHGVRVLNQGLSGITTSYALRIAAQSGATSSWAIACDGVNSPSYHVGRFMFGASQAASTLVELQETETLTASPADGYAASLTLDPGYTGAHTVTRHNYIDAQNPSVAGGAAMTDACLVRFDAAAGSHKATLAGSNKQSPGNVSAWVKININGTLHFIPTYTSTTD